MISLYIAEELKVRLDAGIRILSFEQDLVTRNNTILNDLAAARELQKSLQTDILPNIPGLEYATRLIPSSYLSGDILNLFRLDEKHIGLYHIDVMGHGVRAALFSFFINQRITNNFTSMGILKTSLEAEPYYRINTPREMAVLLNRNDLLEEHGSYFTMLYAVFNTETGTISMYRAGHNLPLI
ncbi:MAG: SpoIIE family protein phosphatase, partial [Planctomycetes bacterium]|nr:SpoIIE family protein phosphatase [Planctomycetota bacterium]